MLNQKEIREIIRRLAKSKGFYSRLNASLDQMNASFYERCMKELTSIGFEDEVALLLYLDAGISP